MKRKTKWRLPMAAGLAAPLAILASGSPAPAATNAPIVGEIEILTLDDPADHWSGGKLVVSGQSVIIPRNLLLDLPANRLTLQELFLQAPVECRAAGQAGLAKGDACNTTGAGGIATITANRTDGGNVIAGDVFLEKGIASVTGVVTYIDYNQGYYRLNGNLGDANTGVMVRLNDPEGRHTIQNGLGCAPGNTANCSPDPRFTLDPDNYTNVFTTGYPLCIPSTVSRPFPGLAAATGIPARPAGTTAAATDGSGDALCPQTNRPAAGPVADSRVFAPVRYGDSVTAEGNFEIVGGVRFLSAHSTTVNSGLTTRPDPTQPDYLMLEEFEVDAAAFQNQRLRTLMIGFATLGPPDVLIWSVHYDPVTNSPHEFPMASVRGCDVAAGPGACGGQGLTGQGNLIWKIRHDVDFTVGAAKPDVNPCAHLISEPRFGSGFCPSGGAGELNTAEQFGILSPISREVQARTGHSLANPGLVTLDVRGNVATNGQYLFPFGAGLGGIAFPEMVEIDLNALATPFSFTGLPWTLDRRLSPGGCFGACEATAQPLDPYPFEGTSMDPRTLASVPQGPYNDPNFTASVLSRTADRILSYVDGNLGRFNGDATVLAWPPANPAGTAVPVVPIAVACAVGTGGGVNSTVVANDDAAAATPGVPTAIDVTANDTGTLNLTTLEVTSGPTNGTAVVDLGLAGTVTFTSNAGFIGTDTFTYVVQDAIGLPSNTATVTVTVNDAAASPPVAAADTATANEGVPVTIALLANDTAAAGTSLDPASVQIVTPPANGLASWDAAASLLTYTPALGVGGPDTLQYVVRDLFGSVSGPAAVTVTVNRSPATTADPAGPVRAGQALPIDVLANDSDPDGPGIDPASVQLSPVVNGTATAGANGSITFTGAAEGPASFTYTVADGAGARSAPASVSVQVTPPGDVLTVTSAQYRTGNREWRLSGTTNLPVGQTITIRVGSTLTGPVIGTATVSGTGSWAVRRARSAIRPDATRTISVESTRGGVLLGSPHALTR